MRKRFVSAVAVLLLCVATVHAQDASTSGNLTAAGQTVVLELDSFGTAAFQVTGTWVATLNFEATVDGTNWFPVNVFRVSDFAAVTTSTANGEWMTGVAGYQRVRVRAQPYTSGTAVVNIRAASQSQPIPVSTSTPSTVTVNNGAGAAAVNIQDGGNAITVDGTVACSNCGASFLDNATFTVGATAIGITGGVRLDAPADVANGDAAAVRITRQRAAHVSLRRDNDGAEATWRTLNDSPLNTDIGPTVRSMLMLRQNDSQIQNWTASASQLGQTAVLPGVRTLRTIGTDTETLAGINQQIVIETSASDYESCSLTVRDTSFVGTLQLFVESGGSVTVNSDLFNVGSGQWVDGSNVPPTDALYVFPCAGMVRAILRATAYTSGSVDVAMAAGPGTNGVYARTELALAAALTDNFPNPTTAPVGAFNMVWDGSAWDRWNGAVTDGGGSLTIDGPETTTTSAVLSALGQTVQLNPQGQASAGAFVEASTLAGTIIFEHSPDGGTTWRTSTVSNTLGSIVSSTVNPSAGQEYSWLFTGTQSVLRVRVSAYTSGSITMRLLANTTLPFNTLAPSTVIPGFTSSIIATHVAGVNASGVAASLQLRDGAPASNADGVVTRQVGLPAAAALADNTANPTLTQLQTFQMVWDSGGTNWDRMTQPLTDTQLRASPVPVSAASLPLPTGAATLAEQQTQTTSLQLLDDTVGTIAQPIPSKGVLVLGHDVTFDLGRQLEVDLDAPSANATGLVTRQVGMPQAAALADNTANPTLTQLQTFQMVWDSGGTNWDRMTQPLTDAQLRASPVPVSAASLPLPTGAATEATLSGYAALFPAGAALADDTANPTLTKIQNFNMVWDSGGTNWDRMVQPLTDTQLRASPVPIICPAPGGCVVTATDLDIRNLVFATDKVDVTNSLVGVAGIAADGAAVAGNPVRIGGKDGSGNTQDIMTDTDGNVQVDVLTSALPTGAATEATLSALSGKLPAAAALSDNFANPTTTQMAAMAMIWDGATWDRWTGVVKELRASTPALTNVNDTAVSTTCLAANGNRLGATIYNDSTATLYVKFGATASTTSFTYKLFQDGALTVPNGYTGIIDCIWSADSTGAARVTEVTQ